MGVGLSYQALGLDWPWLSYSKEYLCSPPSINDSFTTGILYVPVSAVAYVDFQYHSKTLILANQRPSGLYLFTYIVVKSAL